MLSARRESFCVLGLVLLLTLSVLGLLILGDCDRDLTDELLEDVDAGLLNWYVNLRESEPIEFLGDFHPGLDTVEEELAWLSGRGDVDPDLRSIFLDSLEGLFEEVRGLLLATESLRGGRALGEGETDLEDSDFEVELVLKASVLLLNALSTEEDDFFELSILLVDRS